MAKRYQQLGSDVVKESKRKSLEIFRSGQEKSTEMFRCTYQRVAICFTEERAKQVTELLNKYESEKNQTSEGNH